MALVVAEHRPNQKLELTIDDRNATISRLKNDCNDCHSVAIQAWIFLSIDRLSARYLRKLLSLCKPKKNLK